MSNRLLTMPRPTFPDSCKAFYAAAEAAGAIIHVECLWRRGIRGLYRKSVGEDELVTIAAYRGTSEPQSVLFVTTGLHGSELYMGSMLVNELMGAWDKRAPAHVGLLAVHGLNPWGSSHSHRNDENNVDPNRANWEAWKLRDGTLTKVATSPEYVELNPYINPRLPDLWRYTGCLKAVCEFWLLEAIRKWSLAEGKRKLKRVIGTGQGDYPQGVFYAGDGRPTRSAIALRRIVRRCLPKSAERVLLLDLHTGLGRAGEFSLISHFPKGGRENERMERMFGVGTIEATAADESIAVHSSGVIETLVADELAREHGALFLGLCVEIGTYKLLKSSWAVCARNAVGTYLYEDPECPYARESRAYMDEIFFPANRALRESVLERGREIFRKAIEGLAQCT